MAIIVPVVLGGLALAVMALVAMGNQRRRKAPTAAAANQVRILIHAINDDRCTGCDACVAVCPTNVLDLVQNKSRVLRFQDCIQCEACMWACPTEALVMFPEGTAPPPVRAPDINESYETAIPGQYLIGEVAGKPLVKNAANLGRGVVEHMLRGGLVPGKAGDVDVLIVGSGPGGMSAALTCQQRGLRYIVIEKENIISSTVSRYPKGKLVMAEPYDTDNLSLLPVFDSTKEEMVSIWKQLTQKVEMRIKLHETVQTVVKQPDGLFLAETTGGQYRAQRVVLATGTRGKPRTLGVPGENFPKVESLLEDPDDHRGKAVCVVGGGDSALEAAMALAESQAKVILSYRGRTFHRAQAKNRQKVERMEKEGRLKVKLQSEVVEFGEDTVTLQMKDGTQKRYPNHAAFILIGADPPIKWLSTLGIHYVNKPHMQPMPASDAFVRAFVPNAVVCPDSADEAAALVFNQPVSAGGERAPRPPTATREKAGLGRRFVRSASQLFGINEDSGPVPLSEFARRERTRERDKLEPGERTRLLRMLRDEGGRYADEDSQVELLDDIMAEAADPTGQHAVQLSPEPAYDDYGNNPLPTIERYPQAPPMHLDAPQGLPASDSRPSRAPRPSQLPLGARSSKGSPPVPPKRATRPPPIPVSGNGPTEALIVGLASARSSRGGLGLFDEKTEHVSEDEVSRLAMSARREKPTGPPPPPKAVPAFSDEPTNLMDFDPERVLREAESEAGPLFADDDTFQEKTRNVDVDTLLSEAGFGEGKKEKDPRTEPEFARDERSLSEVEWDLD